PTPTTYDVLKPSNFVGLQNYIDLASDETFGKALYNTLYFVVFHGPTAILMALILALLLNAKVRGVSIWRTLYYLPQVTPAVALGVLWLRILSPNNGLLNSILAGVGIQGPAWTVDADWVKPSLILIRVFVVGTWMITFLAALQDVPQELYEAASIDGANAWQRFRNVTLPMISRVIFFAVIAITIFSMNVFDIAYFMFPPQVFGALVFFAIVFVFPFVWLLSNSLKDPLHIFDANLIPQPIVWQNYVTIFQETETMGTPLISMIRNSVIVSVLGVTAVLISSS